MATVANIYLEESADTSGTAFSIANNDTMIAGGATDSDYISIASGVTGTVVASTIEDVTLSGAIGDYKFKQGFGSNLEIYNSSDVLVATITDVDGKNLTFNKVNTALVYNETTGSMSVGGSNITTTAAVLDTTAPVFQSAATSTDGSTVTLTYGEALDATTAAAGAFSVSDNTVSSAVVNGSTVVLTVGTPIANGATVTVSYTDPTSKNDANAIQDAAGNDAATIAIQAVTNNVPAPTPTPALSYSATTFTEAVANDGTITMTSIITLVNDTFTGSNSDALGTVTNAPDGMTATLVRASDTTATLSLTGTATNHEDTNGISDLTVTFADGDFTTSNAADVTGATNDKLAIDFADAVTVSGTAADLATASTSWTGDENVSITDAHALANLKTINDATTGEITLADASVALSGSLADVNAALAGTITTYTGNVTLSDATLAAADVDALAALTSGAVTATITETTVAAVVGMSNVDTSDVITATVNDASISAADAATLVANVDTLTLNNGATATEITGTTTISDYNALDALTTGAVTATVDATDNVDVFLLHNNILTIGTGTAFTNETDDISFKDAAASGTLQAATAITNDGTGTDGATLDATNTNIYVIDTDATDLDAGNTAHTIVDFTDMGNVAAFLTEGFVTSNVDGKIDYFVINDGDVGTAAYVYKFVNEGSDTVIDTDGSELTLIGTVTTNDAATTVNSIAIA